METSSSSTNPPSPSFSFSSSSSSSFSSSSSSSPFCSVCAHHLIAIDTNPVLTGVPGLVGVRKLLSALFRLPQTKDQDGRALAVLPESQTFFKRPRALPVPKPKPKTRWQEFAEAKGVNKPKRARKVWDETIGDWAPRWGYKSIKKNQKYMTPIIEVQPGQDPYQDPFEKVSQTKTVSKARQKFREVRNIVEGSVLLPAGVPNLTSNVNHRRVGKANLKEVMGRARVSSASVGRFDKPDFVNEQAKKRGERPSGGGSSSRSKRKKQGFAAVMNSSRKQVKKRKR